VGNLTFIQTIEYTTSRIEEMDAVYRDWEAVAQTGSTATRMTSTRDRDKPNTYIQIVEFPSYEEAMANSNDPQTTQFAQRMSALCDGPTIFRNLDVTDVTVMMPQGAKVEAGSSSE
jgi:hypothetical protein